MNHSEREKSGFEFSSQAEAILDDIEFTEEGVNRFFTDLSKKGNVELPRFRTRFFIRASKICVSKLE
jgi:hypothetical protein